MNDALGLRDCTSVRVLKVFVEIDTSDAMYDGHRRYKGFYEDFSADLLEAVLKEVPSVKVVELDAWKHIKKNGPMVSGLVEIVARYDKVVGWGPESRWDQESDQVWLDTMLMENTHVEMVRGHGLVPIK